MNTAKVFADYLNLDPVRDGWAYSHPYNDLPDDAIRPAIFIPHTLTATSPLSAEPTIGWLERLVIHEAFTHLWPNDGREGFMAEARGTNECPCDFMFSDRLHPTHAVARALIAADPALRARLEKCSDWEEVNRG